MIVGVARAAGAPGLDLEVGLGGAEPNAKESCGVARGSTRAAAEEEGGGDWQSS